MPIRFRCAYCNQLMGISRRKAGQAVRCPTCSGQVIVPKLDEGPKDEAEAAHNGGAALFEKSDFDKDLFDSRPSIQPGNARPGGFAAVPQAPAAAPAAAPPPPAPAPAAPPQPAPQGILLTTGKATVLAVLLVLLLGVAFFAGMLVGRS